MSNAIGFALSPLTREQYIKISLARMAIRNVERNLGNEFFHVDKVTRDWAVTLEQLTRIPVLQPSSLATINGRSTWLPDAAELLRQSHTLVKEDTTARKLSNEITSTEHNYPLNVTLCTRVLRLVSCARHLIRSWQQAVVAGFVGLQGPRGEWEAKWTDEQSAMWERERVELRSTFVAHMRDEERVAPDVPVKQAAGACFDSFTKLVAECRTMARKRSGDDVQRCTVSRTLSHDLNMLRCVYPWRFNPRQQEQAIKVQKELLGVMLKETVFFNSIDSRVADIVRYQDDEYHFYSAVDPMLGPADHPWRYPFAGVASVPAGPTYFDPEVCHAITQKGSGEAHSVMTAAADHLGRSGGAGYEPRLSANITLAQHLMEVIDRGRKATQFTQIYHTRNELLIAFKKRLEAFASCDLGDNNLVPEQVFSDTFRVYCQLSEVATPLRYIVFDPGTLLGTEARAVPGCWTRPASKEAFAPGELEALFLGLFLRILGEPSKGNQENALGLLADHVRVSGSDRELVISCGLPKAEERGVFPRFFDALLAHAGYVDPANLDEWKNSAGRTPLKLAIPFRTTFAHS